MHHNSHFEYEQLHHIILTHHSANKKKHLVFVLHHQNKKVTADESISTKTLPHFLL